MPDPLAAAAKLFEKSVYVGIPRENDARPDDAIGNAALAYIHEYGSPAHNIPARSFMRPGVADAQTEIEKYLRLAAEAALKGDEAGFEKGLTDAGHAVTNSIKMKIQAGIPPLLKERSIRRSRTKARRSASPGSATPLYDTGDLLRSITSFIE